jgi:single-stranded-DNA-specific exonuclease
MEKWVIRNKKGDFEKLARETKLLPVTAKLLCNRGIHTAEEASKYLHPEYGYLIPPFEMRGMDSACGIIRDAVAEGRKIRVVGDYDVDGITATYILESGLKELGADVSSRIPDRVKDGYGINEAIIREAKADGVSLIITCDNGIRAVDEVALAYSLGMRVIVTDHHDIPEILPECEVILNAKLPKCRYPFTEICGAVTALKLIEALNCKGDEKSNTDILKKYIEIAALATVCDVVELTSENRYIVWLGLEKIRKDGIDGFPVNSGIKALMQINNIDNTKVGSHTIGFVLGPCINACGRLDTALLGLKLLNSEGEAALEAAGKLLEQNNERKELTKQSVEDAVGVIEKTNALKDRVLVIFLENCHESIAGIVAGRIREKYDRPAIILTPGEDHVKGSARSIEGYNITEELEKCSGLLLRFGGHAMAAGLSLEKGNIDTLRETLNQNCTLTEDSLAKKISIDLVMPAHYASERLCEELELLEPFGTGNPEPLFAERNCVIKRAFPIGKEGRFLRISSASEDGFESVFVFFGDKEAFENDITYCYGADTVSDMYSAGSSNIRVSFTYVPSINEFRGTKNVELKLKNYLI